MSGTILGDCNLRGNTDKKWVEAQDDNKYPTMHRTEPTMKNSFAPKCQ